MKRVLVAGEINVDLVFAGLPALPRLGHETLAQTLVQCPGSSSMILAMGLARLGDAVSFAGHCGNDAFGRYCIDALRERGIDTRAIHADDALHTGVTVAMSAQGDRALLTWAGAIADMAAVDVNDTLLDGARHLHVSSYYLQRNLRPRLAKLFERARAAGVTTSLDPGCDPAGLWGREMLDVLRHVDVFLPNADEARALSDRATPGDALRAFANGHTQTVIKLGAQGALTLIDGQTISAPGFSMRTLDTTGAGDSFDAGFLHAWLCGLPPLECLRWGNACGALSTRGFGGTATQADANEVERFLAAQ